MEESNLWVDKYRPTKVGDMCLEPTLSEKFCEWIDSGTMPNITLYGSAGRGKTTLAMILAKAIASDICYINCGQSGSVDDIRTEVFDFCKAMAMDDRPKIVILDEADGLSKSAGQGSSAQDALRGLIEETQHSTRFILTCNFINKIIAPIQSRCTPIELKFSQKDALLKCAEILKNEEVEYSNDVLKEFHTKVILKKFPDLRAVINTLRLWVIDNTLTVQDITSGSELDDFIIALMKLIKKKDFETSRQYWLDNEVTFGDYENLAGALFEYESDVRTRLIIGKHLHEMAIVLDKEINFLCMIYELYQ